MVHLYGQLAEMNKINAIRASHNLLVIEDAAQAHGLTFNGNLDFKYVISSTV